MWVEKEIEHSRPKLKALEDELKEKLKEREILAEEVSALACVRALAIWLVDRATATLTD